jgi:DNA polymerase zeta
MTQVKQYLQRQWGKILSGRISLHDFIFAKEVRLGTYSARASVLPPAAIVASKAMAVDPQAEPRYGERVPYVVVHGEPGARLSDVVVDPHTMLANGLRLHDTYYITKQIIPALQRVFGLVGADLKLWFAELPRSNRRNKEAVQQKGTIDHYYLSQHCTVCGQLMRGSQLVCTACISNPQAVVTVLTTQTAQLEKEFKHLEAVSCSSQN